MEEAVEAFKKTRATVLEMARAGVAKSKRSPKRKADDVGEGNSLGTAPETKRVRSSARLSQNKMQPSYAPQDVEEEEKVAHIPDSEDDDEFDPETGECIVFPAFSRAILTTV